MLKKIKKHRKNIGESEKIQAWENIFKVEFGWSRIKLNTKIMLYREKFNQKYYPFITGHYRAGYHSKLYKWFYFKMKKSGKY